MTLYQVRAIYDFSGEPGTAELSIATGEILDVSRVDVGEGWWEGRNSKGQTGLFPAAYVEKVTSAPSRPPPVLPAQPRYDQAADDWGETNTADQNYSKADGEAWEDDWDDDTYSEIGPQSNQVQPSHKQEAPNYPLPGMPINEFNDDTVSNYGGPQTGTVARKNLNRFTNFAKSGDESYILGTLKVDVPEETKIHIVQDGDSYFWAPNNTPYSVVVASPKKESKFKGMKSFIAYQLTPSFNNIQVSRRYKHFDWLHERLTEKFCIIPIPPLPDKQISGRYEEQFIEHRRAQLQEFVDWMCRHPVLSISEVWQHFLTCTDEKRWKTGKRQAEKDQLTGPNCCITIFPPEKALLHSQVENSIEQCNLFIHSVDGAVKNAMAMCADQTKKHQGPYKREYQKIGELFYSLGNALGIDEGTVISTSKLTSAMKMTGGAYIEIGRMFEDQPKTDWEPLGDKFHLYKGIVASFPDVLAVQKGAVQKRKECERLTGDQKMQVTQLNEVIRRTDVVSYAVLAEISHFKSERTTDLKAAMRLFLKEQVLFYRKIADKLENTLKHFED